MFQDGRTVAMGRSGKRANMGSTPMGHHQCLDNESGLTESIGGSSERRCIGGTPSLAIVVVMDVLVPIGPSDLLGFMPRLPSDSSTSLAVAKDSRG